MKCTSKYHRYGPLPANLPIDAFSTYKGRVRGVCLHCKRIKTLVWRLVHHPTHPQPPTFATIHTAYRASLRRERLRQARGTARQGQRWCSHTQHQAWVPVRAFYGNGRTKYWCKWCHRANMLRRHWFLSHNEWLAWEEVTRRLLYSTHKHTRQKNLDAPPGMRWCTRHGGYWTPPAHVRHRGSRAWCKSCRAVADSQRRPRRQHAPRPVSAAD